MCWCAITRGESHSSRTPSNAMIEASSLTLNKVYKILAHYPQIGDTETSLAAGIRWIPSFLLFSTRLFRDIILKTRYSLINW